MQKRIEFFDLAKGVCIILVVAFHMTEFYHLNLPAANFFRSFRLPLYFFLSGLFFKTYSGFFDFLKRKFNKLLIPFCFWYLLLSVIVPFALYKWGGVNGSNTNYAFIDLLFNFFNNETFPNAPIWFLLCLFEVNILFYIIKMISQRFFKDSTVSICVMSLIFGIIGVSLGLFKIDLPMYFDSSLSSLPFFVFGYYINKRTSLLEEHPWDKYDILISIVLFSVVLVFAKYYWLRFNYFPSVFNAVLAYPCGFLGTMAIILLCKKIKTLPLITFLGRYSIMILVTHVMVYKLFATIVNWMGVNGWLAFVVNLFLTLISYLAIIPFMKKFMPHVTAQKDIIPVGKHEKLHDKEKGKICKTAIK